MCGVWLKGKISRKYVAVEMTTTGLKSCKYCRVIKLGKSGLVKKKVASSKKRRLYSGSNKYAYFLPERLLRGGKVRHVLLVTK